MDMNNAVLFAKVVEARGFSAAARLLGIPKTTISKKIGDLEAELGVRLLNRTTRSVSLTEAGEQAHAHIVTAMQHMATAESAARAAQRDPSGMLTVAAPGAIAAHFLLPAITGFMARFPAISVTTLSVDAPIDLAAAGVDVLVWPGVAAPAGHMMRLVAQVEIGLYASTDYLARRGAVDGPADLATHDAVAFVQAFAGGHFAWDVQRGDRRTTVRPASPPRFRSNDPAALLAAVAAGQGIGALPVRFVEQAGAPAQLIRVLPDWQAESIALNAVFRDGSASSAKTRLFLDAVAIWFREH